MSVTVSVLDRGLRCSSESSMQEIVGVVALTMVQVMVLIGGVVSAVVSLES